MLQAPTPELVLASGSAARRALLEAARLRVTIRPPDVDEADIKRRCQAAGDPRDSAALTLATAKAAAIGRDMPEALVIGADQLLVCDGVWFDKPGTDADQAVFRVVLQDGAEETVTLGRRDGAWIAL